MSDFENKNFTFFPRLYSTFPSKFHVPISFIISSFINKHPKTRSKCFKLTSICFRSAFFAFLRPGNSAINLAHSGILGMVRKVRMWPVQWSMIQSSTTNDSRDKSGQSQGLFRVDLAYMRGLRFTNRMPEFRTTWPYGPISVADLRNGQTMASSFEKILLFDNIWMKFN